MGIKYLCLNTLRTFWKKKLQLFAIGSIIFLSSFLYTTMFYAMDSLTLSIERLAAETNQEDFSIEMIDAPLPEELKHLTPEKQMAYSTYTLNQLKKVDFKVYEGILKQREKTFNKHYPDYSLEVRQFKDIEYDYEGEGHKIRIFRPSEQINLTYIENGRMPSGSGEIAINSVYTKANGIEVGDTLTIDEKDYVLVGNLLLSDMNFPMFGDSFIIDNTKLTIGVTSPRTYEGLKGKEHVYFAGVFDEPTQDQVFKDEVIEDVKEHEDLRFITTVIETKNQMRSGAIYEELKSGQAMVLGLCMIISSLAVMIVGILVSKLLKSEKIQIGVLKALGYSPAEVAMPYILLLLIIAVPMLILGYIGGHFLATPMKNFYLMFYLLPDYTIAPKLEVVGVSIMVPLFLILSLSFGMIYKMLNKKTLDLLKVGEKEGMPGLAKLMHHLLQGRKATTKFKYTFIFKNTGKFVLFFWGITFASMMILMSFMMMDFFDKMTVDYFESVNYSYEGYIDPSKPKPRLRREDETYLSVGNGFYEGEAISLKGLEVPNQLHKIYNSKDKDITHLLTEGVIINQSFRIMFQVNVGDVLDIELGEEHYTLKVVGVSKDYGGEVIYMNKEDLSLMVTENKSSKLFSGVYSTLPLDKESYLMVTSKEDIINQTQLMQVFVKVAIGYMVGAAIFIAVLILYILTTMTVEDNFYNISLLKVMGYSKGEVNNMILNSYFVYALFTYLISVPITYISKDFMVKYFSQAFNVVMPMELTVLHVLLGGVIIIVIFMMGTYAAKRQIQKVSLQEVLKAYRE